MSPITETPEITAASDFPALPALPVDGRLRVWAPNAKHVTLHQGGDAATTDATPMSVDEALADAGRPGWWVSADAVPPGTDYAFSVDGGEPRPDPRSPWQPRGVHAPSRTFDVAAHTWGDTEWRGAGPRGVLGAVLYELHIGTFTPEGTLDAAIGKLPHLRDLGVQAVSLMPVAAFPGERGWGYDGVALYAVQDSYGGPAALQRFVDAAHQAGIAVILDVVYNHLGPAGNYLPVFGPYFTDRHETPWGWAVNLDGEDAAEVRAFLIENALRWMRDFHLDGLRLDAVHALIDDSPCHFLADLSLATAALAKELGRPLSLIPESDLNDVRMVTPVGDVSPTTGLPGLGMDAQWTDDVHHAIHALFTGETQGYYCDFGTGRELRQVFEGVFRHQGDLSTFRGKPWGAPVGAHVDRHKFVVSAQTHDQVGNRAIGDRPSRTLSDARLVGQAALYLLGPFTPMIFQGEEWGTKQPFQYFTDHDAELGAAVSAGRMEEFAGHGWEELYGEAVKVPDPQARSTFEDSKLPWRELTDASHAAVLDAYRRLIALRREPDIASGDAHDTRLIVGPGDAWVLLRRGRFNVAVSLSDRPQTVPFGVEGAPVPASAADPADTADPAGARIYFSFFGDAALGKVKLAVPANTVPANGVGFVELPPYAVAVVG